MRNPKFDAFLKHASELHEKKNHDYAADDNPYSNFEFAASYAGVTVDQVFDVLVGIKQARLLELTKSGKKPNNESVWDTTRDLAVYAMLKASYSMEAPVIPTTCPGFASCYNRITYCFNCGGHYDEHPRPDPSSASSPEERS